MPDLEITFDEVRKQNIEQLKILNRAIFPINYQVIRFSHNRCHSDDLLVLLWHSIDSESHRLHPLPSLDMQDRIYQDILASGGVSQLGACHVFHASCSISCAEAPCKYSRICYCMVQHITMVSWLAPLHAALSHIQATQQRCTLSLLACWLHTEG